jgi:16S rRNA (cytosine967-C5)-methyltransferase
MNVDAREIALRIINEVYRKQAYVNIVLAREINTRRLPDHDRRFVTELVYGTVKAGATVDWILGHFVDRSLAKIPAVIRDILRLGIYQLFFLTKVPPSAVCNQAVELAKKYGHSGTVKFVNAVLRSAARHPEKVIYPDRGEQPVAHIALRHCHPQWLVTRWLARLGIDGCEELCRVNNLTPLLSIRTNTLRTSRVALLEQLAREQVVCEPSSWTPEGIICREFPALGSLASLQQGLFQVQDESSMLVAHVLDPQPGEFVIDACGAPGGKSTHLAAKMQNRGQVLSVDIHAHKSAITRENALRLGIDIIEAKTMDALELGALYSSQADRVLVDAPCSGLGVLRRKPDSRWRKTEALVLELPLLQQAILHSAAACVKPGGVLVYSTCTTEPEENEAVLRGFLSQHPEYVLQNTGQFLPQQRPENLVQLWPHVDGVDGFFIARLIRGEAKVGPGRCQQ